MKLVIFGLSITSSWGNGHATLWRGLCRGLVARGHQVVFFERDTPYYAEHRDLRQLAGAEIILYRSWEEVRGAVRRHLGEADAAIITSYCADAVAAEIAARDGAAVRVFYDLDSPVTLSRRRAGEEVSYLGPDLLRAYDLVLSYTGGAALRQLQEDLGAVKVAPLYGSVDPELHRPVAAVEGYRAHLSYLGTFAADRQAALEGCFIEPARRRPAQRFLLGGAQYPPDFPWTANIHFVRHLPPGEHPAFFCSSRLTLNVTRAAMAASGYCPSGRLFEAAACGAAVLTDGWEGLETFFTPGQELLVVRGVDDVLRALELSDQELALLGGAARERALQEHTAGHRAAELEGLLEAALPNAVAI